MTVGCEELKLKLCLHILSGSAKLSDFLEGLRRSQRLYRSTVVEDLLASSSVDYRWRTDHAAPLRVQPKGFAARPKLVLTAIPYSGKLFVRPRKL